MKLLNIQYASDLHLDQLTTYQPEELIVVKSNILILGGDICHIMKMDNHQAFFQYVSNSFQYVLYIPGNHEFYMKKENCKYTDHKEDIYSKETEHTEYTQNITISDMELIAKTFLNNFKNIIYLNNASVFIEDILFTGSCLWCNPENEPPAWFHIPISAKEIREMYHSSVEYLNKISSLQFPRHMIITHYPPLPIMSSKRPSPIRIKYNDYYQNSMISLQYPPSIWMFGHIHENVTVKKQSTLYISNQRKDKKYNPSLTISI
jgi:predicted phosphohydrolase